MKNEMKSKEEIIIENEGNTYQDEGGTIYHEFDSVIKAMQSYATQEVEVEKARLNAIRIEEMNKAEEEKKAYVREMVERFSGYFMYDCWVAEYDCWVAENKIRFDKFLTDNNLQEEGENQ